MQNRGHLVKRRQSKSTKVTLRSWCDLVNWPHGIKKISIKWLWPVKVTLEIIKRRILVFCWSCDESPLKWNKKKLPSLQFVITNRLSLFSPLNSNDRSIPLTYEVTQTDSQGRRSDYIKTSFVKSKTFYFLGTFFSLFIFKKVWLHKVNLFCFLR